MGLGLPVVAAVVGLLTAAAGEPVTQGSSYPSPPSLAPEPSASGAPVSAQGGQTTLRAHVMEARLAFGLHSAAESLGDGMTGGVSAQFGIAWGITDRLQLGLFNLAYRVGEPGTVELVPSLGLAGLIDFFGSSGSSGLALNTGSEGTTLIVSPAAGTALRIWLGERWTLNGTVDGAMGLQFPGESANLTRWSAGVSLGFSRFVGDLAVVNLGVRYGYSHQLVAPTTEIHEFVLGSVQSCGGRVMPLVAVKLSPKITLETQAVFVIRPHRHEDARELRLLEGVAITW